MSRGMQNLTARYNYIYNANVILEDYEEALHTNYKDNYNEILPVYTAPEKFSSATVLNPPVNEKELDAVISKSQAIIADKAFSNYIDEAYLLMGKANYLKTYYFVAEEYFDYTIRSYPANTAVQVNALNWKARSLMQLNNMKDAALVLDTLYSTLPMVKNHKAEPLATIAQMYIYQERYDDAVAMLENAVKLAPLKRNRIRWTYILAQLYELQKNYQEALRNYVKVQKSNAGFELYFNANLSRIKMEGLLNGERLNRKKQLTSLLKDDKNLEYIDQIYYQIAESHAEDGNFNDAAKYYRLSVRSSNQNNYQKGLSYLRMADINFKEQKNFVQAKLYYDSTVNTLPKSYPGYEQLVKKSQNLEYLTTRYETVAFEDTLQVLAKLPEEERLIRIRKITTPAPGTITAASNSGKVRNDLFPDAANSVPATTASGAFYFSNKIAVNKGYADFILKWGTRKAEDNWRQSVKSSAQTTIEAIAKVENATPGAVRNGEMKPVAGDSLLSRYVKAMPLTTELVALSNQRIIDAYYEIANYYQQELDDQPEAVKVYELILNRFPDNNHLASIYYGLSLSYTKTDPKNALKYRTLVLEKFPQSIYAKTILDPDYSAKQSLAEAEVIKKYNDIFSQYEKKAFPAVITEVNTLTGQFPDNLLNPQLSYLRAIAIGRTRQIDSLTTAFKGIVNLYPDDQLITPLVKDHLAYITAHLDEFKKRKVALPDFDLNEPRFFVSQPLPVPPVQQQVATVPAAEKPEPAKATDPVPAPAVKTPEAVVPGNIFSTEISTVYYYVIDVEDASLTLSSSRFGIGQFNRGNYGDAGLRHQLTEFDNDQLIYVGNFSSFAEAKSYSDGITPQLRQIMKVPANIYKNFIISKENFEKIQSKDLVTKYLEFYNNNYQK